MDAESIREVYVLSLLTPTEPAIVLDNTAWQEAEIPAIFRRVLSGGPTPA